MELFQGRLRLDLGKDEPRLPRELTHSQSPRNVLTPLPGMPRVGFWGVCAA